MTPELSAARAARGLPPYRHEPPTWRHWTTEDVAAATGSTPGAISQRARRGQFPGAVKMPNEDGNTSRWLIPEEVARAFVRAARARDGRGVLRQLEWRRG